MWPKNRKGQKRRNTGPKVEERIVTDPFGSYTGIPMDAEKPVQDTDDL